MTFLNLANQPSVVCCFLTDKDKDRVIWENCNNFHLNKLIHFLFSVIRLIYMVTVYICNPLWMCLQRCVPNGLYRCMAHRNWWCELIERISIAQSGLTS